MLIRCRDTRVQSYPTFARKIFGVAKKRRVPAEKCSYRSMKKANMFKTKTLIEKVGTRYLKQVSWSPHQALSVHRLNLSVPQTGDLIISVDNSWPLTLPFHSALNIPQPNILTIFCTYPCVRECEWVLCVCVFMSERERERVCVCVCVCVCLCEWICLWWWAMLIKREYVWLRNI